MNRQDLAWCINATLPHAGKSAMTALVGLVVSWESVTAYATDDYTAGVARIPHGVADALAVQLPTAEARELLRFVRPNLVGERDQEVVMREHEGEPCDFHREVTGSRDPACENCGPISELHVAVADDTAVFELTSQALCLDTVLGFMAKLNNAPEEWQHALFQPSFAARFAKAERSEGDRLRLYPRHTNNRYGAALVTVGTDFIGAVAGLEYDDAGDGPLLSFLQPERNAA